MTPPETPERVKMELTRTVTVLGVDDRPALELKAVGVEVRVMLLPRNSSTRFPVRISDLARAVEQLKL